MIAILAVAVVGIMAAVGAVGYGVHRMVAKPVDDNPPVTRFRPPDDPDTDRLAAEDDDDRRM